ncbi:hypothetical protein [Sphingobacterium bambusae]|uniref:Uncharacterized protein n=1 Tax=Sphingobacterium bambusae TaxID=662858 RepID=A0ABW6BJN1_9SPHI|nr:hypothetical protein [Sphingobacterium bambusae]WPL47648.1 hypothetical protein SCB77_16990 [Sphingobacterium bambusae]
MLSLPIGISMHTYNASSTNNGRANGIINKVPSNFNNPSMDIKITFSSINTWSTDINVSLANISVSF